MSYSERDGQDFTEAEVAELQAITDYESEEK